MYKAIKKAIKVLTAKIKIKSHEGYGQHNFGVELLKAEKKGLKNSLNILLDTQGRIDTLKGKNIYLDIVSVAFKSGENKSTFRGIIHYLHKDKGWKYTDTGIYPDFFKCLDETLDAAEQMADNWTFIKTDRHA